MPVDRHRDRFSGAAGEAGWLSFASRFAARRSPIALRSQARRSAPHRGGAVPRQIHPARRPAGSGRAAADGTRPGPALRSADQLDGGEHLVPLDGAGRVDARHALPRRRSERSRLAAEALAGTHHQLVDVSDYYTVIELAGREGARALMKLTTLDVHPRAFRAGMVTGSVFGRANATIWQCIDDAAEGGPVVPALHPLVDGRLSLVPHRRCRPRMGRAGAVAGQGREADDRLKGAGRRRPALAPETLAADAVKPRRGGEAELARHGVAEAGACPERVEVLGAGAMAGTLVRQCGKNAAEAVHGRAPLDAYPPRA